MGRPFHLLVRFLFLCSIVALIAALTGCSSSSPTTNAPFPVPAKLSLSPATPVSLDVGSTSQTFSAAPTNNAGTALTTPVSFLSSNTSVLTVATNGMACAGTWDSLTAPQICTPGAVGVAQVTATSHGISSPPTPVYVHQRIDNVSISLIPGQILPPPAPCFSKGQVVNYQATATSQGLDITSTVGPFTWQSVSSAVVMLDASTPSVPINGLLAGQARITANTPGITSFSASVGGVNSLPMDFTTCAVQSITLAVTGSSSNQVNVVSGSGKTVTATVLDTLGNTITGVPLTWSSSQPSSVAVSAGAVSSSKGGGASVIASCTPPTCNIGFLPILPIYPESAVAVAVSSIPTTTTTVTASQTIYIASTGNTPSGNCVTASGCSSILIPITAPANTLGAPINLPATPNSLVFDRQSTKAYLGTDFAFLGTRGLMVVTAASPPTVSMFKGVSGKVLTISPDGNKVIVSDTKSTPNQVYVFDTPSSTSVALPIAGATAADYSPDNLKAFIVAGSTLYIYSTLETLQSVPLAAPANDISFLANGAFAYLAGGTPSGVTVQTTCSNAQAATVPTPNSPVFLRSLPSGLQVLGVDSPGIDLINVTSAPVGCSPTVTNTVQSFNLGQGNFVPLQLIMSLDGSQAYILASNLGSVLVFNIGNQTSSAIPLAGDAIPLQASLTSDGTQLYVAAQDGLIHVLDTQTGGDIAQISIPSDPNTLQAGLCVGTPFVCNTDLIAVKP